MIAKCGAKTRSGGKCNSPQMPNGRCRMHGGASTGNPRAGGNDSALKHGIYGDLIRKDDLPFVDNIQSKIGAVDDELLIARLQLRRAIKAQNNADSLPDGLEVYESSETQSESVVTAKSDVKRKRLDYPAMINTLMGRIESLEKTRLELINGETMQPGGETGWKFTVERASKNDA